MLRAVAEAEHDRREREWERRHEWGATEELLAHIAELVHQLTLVVVDVAPGAKWPKGRPDPLHIARPGEQPQGPVVVSPSQLFRHMAGGE